MARRLRSVIAASCAVAAVLALAAPVLSQSYEYRYSKVKAAQDTGGPVDPGPEEPLPSGACLTPWQEEVLSGESVTAFQDVTVAAGNQCSEQIRTCTNGSLSGAFQHPICVADEPGNYPDPITFASLSEVEPKAFVRSSIEQITGIDSPTAIARSGSYTRFRICGDALCATEIRPFSSRATTIAPGQFTQVELRSSDRFATLAEAHLLVGMTQASFSVTTREGHGCIVGDVTVAHDETWDFYQHALHASCASVADTRKCVDGTLLGDTSYDEPFCELIDQDRLPDAFAFTPLLNQETNQILFSNPILLGGFDWKLPISIAKDGTSFASFSICRAGRDCGPTGQFNTWTSTTGSVQAGDSIRLRMRTPAALQSEASISVNVGDFSTTWVSATKAGLTCEAPWGGPVSHGQSLVAYSTPTVDFGTECLSEARLCSNGSLQGSFTHQSCSVDEQDGQPDDLTIAAVVNAEPATTLVTAFLNPTGFTGPLPVRIGAGELAASRVCDTASGASCTVLNDADKTIRPGQFLQFRLRTGDFGETRTLPIEIGPLVTTWSVSSRAGGACTVPWGGQISHAATVTAYRAASVPFGQSCISESRTCSDGSLSGNNLNQFEACTVEPQVVAINPFPLGSALDVNRNATVLSNQVQPTGFTGTITVNISASPGLTFGVRRCTSASCPSSSAWGTWTTNTSLSISPGNWLQVRATSPDYGETGIVTATALGHSETFTARTRAAEACTTPWGSTLQHGNVVTAYNKEVALFNETCLSTSRTCNDGTLQGTSSYIHAQCTQDTIARPTAFSWPDKYAPAGTASVTSGSVQITGTVGSGIPVFVTGDGAFNRNSNSACGATGTWIGTYTQSTIATNAYLCLRANAPSVPGQIKTLTATVGDKTVSWRLIAQ